MTRSLVERIGEEELIEMLGDALREDRYLPGVHEAYQKRIYKVSDGVIGKVGRYEDRLAKEFRLGRLLSEKGLSVPHMYRLVRPEEIQDASQGRDVRDLPWVLLMQRIKGTMVSKLPSGADRRKAAQQYCKGVKKILKLGILPFDMNGWNLIFNQNERRLYFIDFESWEEGVAKETGRDLGAERWFRFPGFEGES